MRRMDLALAAVLGVPLTLASGKAHAGIEACGDIHVDAGATCEVFVGGACMAMCEPLALEASCAADLRPECAASCDGVIDSVCHADCSISCMAVCDVDPADFSSSVYCDVGCDSDCSAECLSAENQGECHASCEATCAAECEAGCQGESPEASCDARCEGSCSGQCRARADMDCQLGCQSAGYADCKTDLERDCEVACAKPEGALFCDGQYVDHGGNLDDCIAALRAQLDIEVEASTTGVSPGFCRAGTCEAEAEADVSAGCSIAAGRPSPGPAGLVALLAIGASCLVGRNRRRS